MGKILRFRVHYTWIPVFAIVTAIITTQFSEVFPLWQRITLGLIVSLLFLAAITVRELVFSATIMRKEILIDKITLFVFGGEYQDNRENIVSTHLPLLYLARFLSNFIIAALFYGLCATFNNTGHLMLAGITQWLAYIYFLIFLLHIVPAFPLDGGQILRMLIWKSSGDYYKATHIASLIGWATGLFFVFAGVLLFIITQNWIISLIIVALGWILNAAAGYTRLKLKTLTALRDVQAQDIMTREFPRISQQVKIGELVLKQILVKGWRYVIVEESAKLKGILTLNQIKSIPGKRWYTITIGDVMTTTDNLRTANPQERADSLFEEMSLRKIDYVPVLEDERIVGVVSKNTLMSLVKTRAEFGV